VILNANTWSRAAPCKLVPSILSVLPGSPLLSRLVPRGRLRASIIPYAASNSRQMICERMIPALPNLASPLKRAVASPYPHGDVTRGPEERRVLA